MGKTIMAAKPIDPSLSVKVIAMFVNAKVLGEPQPTIKQVSRRIKASMSASYALMVRLATAGLIEKTRAAGGEQIWKKRAKSKNPRAARQRRYRFLKKHGIQRPHILSMHPRAVAARERRAQKKAALLEAGRQVLGGTESTPRAPTPASPYHVSGNPQADS